MKALIADKLEAFVQPNLEAGGIEVLYNPELRDEALTGALAQSNADVLVVRSTRVTGPMIEGSSLKLIIRAGAGYNTIDVEAASEHGAYVANCPGMNANAVAEIAFGLILSLDRRIHDNVADLRQNIWNKLAYSSAKGLAGSTLGLIGIGIIGKKMIPRAHAFGMSVVAWSRSLTEEGAKELDIEIAASPVEVAAKSDVLSVHVAFNDDTRNLIDAKVFDAMLPNAMFINTARAEVVDQNALMHAVKSKGIRAGLDVFDDEPTTGSGEVHNEVFALDNVIGTHHIGGQTFEAQTSIAHETVRIILEFDKTGTPPNAVNQISGRESRSN